MLRSFVLVHGGLHDRSCWDEVIPLLEAQGHRAVAIDLPGRGATADRLASVTLDDWVGALDDAVRGLPGLPVLVAHSMGGVSASQYAERRPDSVTGIVYVSAVVPADGASAMETLAAAGAPSILLHDGVLRFSPDRRSATVDPARAVDAFYGRCDPALAQSAVARLVPEAVTPLATPLRLGSAFASVPKAYLGARHDRAVPVALQTVMAERAGATYHALDTDHSPFHSGIDDLVVQIVRAGQAMSRDGQVAER